MRIACAGLNLPRRLGALKSWLDESGVPFGDMPTLRSWLSARGKDLNFAMNAGIFESGTIPTGLLVVDKKERHALNREDGEGNFFAKPNGVFWTKDGIAHIDATEAYRAKSPSPDLATQSGPMLVIEGKLREGIDAFGQKVYLRNGVCVRASGQVLFAISNVKVTMGEFGHLFKEGLGCADALFLDGCRSIIFSPELQRNDAGSCKFNEKLLKAGALIGISSPSSPSTKQGK